MKNEGIFYMFKKIKKHKLSLFLLAMVCMLSVYYVMMPEEKDPAAPVGNIPEGETRYQAFAEMRLEIIDERNAMVMSYEALIVEAKDTALLEEYILEINSISSLTEKEVYLEGIIMNLGYEDCLVYLAEIGYLIVSVLADSLTKAEFNEIGLIAIEEFGEDAQLKLDIVKSS